MTAKSFSLILLATAVLAQNPPPRDAAQQAPPEQPMGTGRIAGVVVAADNGVPVKRAAVTVLRSGPPAGQRLPAVAPGRGRATLTITTEMSVVGGITQGPAPKMTDEAGRFEQSELAAGLYTIMVRPQSGFAPLARPERVTLKDDERVTLTIKLERTGAITGRILDESGDPLARARVTAAPDASSGGPMRIGQGATTDDLGQFRVFDLPAGQYYVSAAPMQPFSTEAAGAPGYATTFYPGAASRDQAQRVVVKSGQDTPNIDFSLVRVALGRITGTVRDAGGQLVTFDPRARGAGLMATVTLSTFDPDAGGGMSSRGASVRPDGTYVVGGIAPGNYYLSASITRGQGPEAEREGVFVPVVVNGDDQHVDLRTNLGATISGRIVIEGTPPPNPLNVTVTGGMAMRPRVMVRPAPGSPPQSFASSPNAGQASDEGEFELKGVRGRLYLTASPASGSAVLKSITYGADDVSTKPLDLKGTERLQSVVVTFTHETGRIEGAVTTNGTAPALESNIIMFPDDEDRWFQGSPFVQFTRTTPEMLPEILARRPPGAAPPPPPGSFRSRPMLPGRYYVIALPGDGSGMLPMPRDAAGFEKLKKDATTATVSAGAVATVQLRLQRP